MFTFDQRRNIPLLVDTGSAVSIAPTRLATSIDQTAARNLRSFGGTNIFSPGTSHLQLDLGYGPFQAHPFCIVDGPMDHLILGIDFLRRNNLILDAGANRLVQRDTGNFSPAISLDGMDAASIKKAFAVDHPDNGNDSSLATGPPPPLRGTTKSSTYILSGELYDNSQKADQLCKEVLDRFPSITGTPDYTAPPKHSHKLDIVTVPNFQPMTCRPRRGSSADMATARTTFEDLIARGAMLRSSSNCVSPVTFARKKNGQTRVCIDYRRLNAQTVRLNYPLPLIQTLSTRLTPDHKFFSVLDLSEAYYSLPLTPRASQLAAIITQDGVFLPLRCPFGLVSAPSKFCELIAEVTRGMSDYLFTYLDDFLVFSKTLEGHLQHLNDLCVRLKQYGLFVKLQKCHLGQSEVSFLGFTISSMGIRPVSDRVAAITQMRPPTSAKELRGFLGMINYYRPYLPDLARDVSPLNNLLRGKRVRRGPLRRWGPEEQNAFDRAIKTLKNAVTLAHEDPNLPLYLTTDASGHHVGGVLEQRTSHTDIAMRPLAFFSTALAPTSRARSAFHRELKGIFLSLRHFKHRVRGRPLYIRTDHHAVVRAIKNGVGEHSPNEISMLAYINEYSPTMVYLPGEHNVVADLLSRPMGTPTSLENDPLEHPVNLLTPSNNEIPPSLLPKLLAEEQAKETDLIGKTETFITSRKLPLEVKGKVLAEEIPLILYGVSDNAGEGFRPIVPASLRAWVFHALHDTAHPGQDRSTSLVSRNYFWSGLATDVSRWVKTCPMCQTAKTTRHNRPRLQNFPSSPLRLSIFHIDLVGPLPPSGGFKYLLTLRDRGTGLALAIPLPDKSSIGVIEALRLHLISTFGVPTTLISDNGGEFASAVFVEFCRRYGINHKFTTPYHPSSNGFVERFHRTLKQSLRALEHADSWATHIPDIILFLNSLPSDGNAFTPFQMTFGQSSNVPGICSLPNEADTSSPAAEDVYAFFHNMGLHYRKARPLPTKHYVHADLNEAKFVWIKNSTRHHPLSPLYKGPFRVLSRTEKWLEVYTDSYIKRVSVDNTKPAFGFSEETSTDDESPAEEEPVLQPEEWLQRRSTSSGRAINRPAWMRDYQ